MRSQIVRRRFEVIADTYDDTIGRRRDAYNSGVDAIIARTLQGSDHLTVLDAGCGTGTRTAKLKTLLGPNTRMYGLDASEAMIARASQAGLDAARVGRLSQLDFPDDKFDVVVCLFFVICYLVDEPERNAAVAEMARVLKPGGLLFIDAMNMWHLGEGMDFRRSRFAAGWDYLRSVLDPRLSVGDKMYATTLNGERLRGFHHAFTHETLGRLLVRGGLILERRHTVGYNSGSVKSRSVEGQLLHVYRKPFDR